MTLRRPTVALLSLLWIVPAFAQAQAPQDAVPDAPVGASVLQVQDVADQIIRVNTRIRHTTVIQLPPNENILDFIVGDSEYWHLTGAANLAFLKPIGEGVNTNVALVCESGRIYSFLVTEQSGPPSRDCPHRRRSEQQPGHRPRPRVSRAVARGRVSTNGGRKPRGGPCRAARRRGADHRHAPGRHRPGRGLSRDLSHAVAIPYELEDKAARRPFLVHGMWHDGQFTYVRSTAQETPALYENTDGQPSLIPYDLEQDGLFIVRRLVGHGWLQIGRERAGWNVDLDDLD